MIIDQLPVLAAVQDTDEVPIERGTATYKTGVAALLKSATDAAQAAQETAEEAQEAADGKPSLQEIFNAVYPVGAIYTSVNSTSPATLFGGTWEQIQDTFLLAAGSAYAAGSTGGESAHTLTVDEMPSHNHFYTVSLAAQSGGVTHKPISYSATGTNVNTSYAGGGQAHNNMPPYLAVYVWKRTA